MKSRRRERDGHKVRSRFLESVNGPRALKIVGADSKSLARELNAEHVGPSTAIETISGLNSQLSENSLTYLGHLDYAKYMTCTRGVVITQKDFLSSVPSSWAALIVPNNPRGYWSKSSQLLKNKRENFPTHISSRASVHKTASIGRDVYISDGAEIGAGVVIVGPAFIGRNVHIGSNSVIGNDGFEVVEVDGSRTVAAHFGGVWIQDDVHIHSLCTIDKGLAGDFTFIDAGTMIDNHVHVAHGVRIGRNSTITASVEISGSVQIGANVWIAPRACIMNGVLIGNNSFIGLGASVRRSVSPNQVIVGFHEEIGYRCQCGLIQKKIMTPFKCSCGTFIG